MGNLLRSDDGAGLRVIEELKKEVFSSNVDLMECMSGLDMLEAAGDYDKIVFVDAIMGLGKPGSVHTLFPEDFDGQQTLHSYSTHLNMDLPMILRLCKELLLKKIPEDITIVAIEAEDITTISDKCTPKVEQAIQKAVDLIKGLVS
jgi:hydrogenase maturation protease